MVSSTAWTRRAGIEPGRPAQGAAAVVPKRAASGATNEWLAGVGIKPRERLVATRPRSGFGLRSRFDSEGMRSAASGVSWRGWPPGVVSRTGSPIKITTPHALDIRRYRRKTRFAPRSPALTDAHCHIIVTENVMFSNSCTDSVGRPIGGYKPGIGCVRDCVADSIRLKAHETEHRQLFVL